MSRHQRHHAVSEDSESSRVGQPISHVTKRGFSRRRKLRSGAQNASPVLMIRGAWRPSRNDVGTFAVGSAASLWSRAVGVAHMLAVVLRLRSPALRGPGHFAPSEAVGVGHCLACTGSIGSRHPVPATRRLLHLPLDAIGVCHCEREQPLSSMRRANLKRREYSRRNPVAHLS